MSAIDRAIEHFSSKAIRTLHIPEWDLDIFTKNLTLEDKAQWVSRAKGETTEYLLYAIVFGAVDANGERLFSLEDKIKLKRNCDPDIVTRIANFIIQPGDDETEEDREKN